MATKNGKNIIIQIGADTYELKPVNGPSSATNNHVPVFDGATGRLIKDSGFTIGKSVPSDAVFTDTHQAVSDGDPTLAWGTRSKVGTIGETDLHVTMPADPTDHFGFYIGNDRKLHQRVRTNS